MASVLQTTFSLPSFRARYYPTAKSHWEYCPEVLPADCLDCQLHKVADGLLSGRYSHPRPTDGAAAPKATNPLAHESPTAVFQEGVRPSMFKALVGRGHDEFATMRQQDAEEFLGHYLAAIRRQLKRTGGADPTDVFRFGMEQRLQCGECQRVRYRVDATDVASVPVPKREKGVDAEGKVQYEEVQLKECLDGLIGIEALEYTCPSCQKQVIAKKYSPCHWSAGGFCSHMLTQAIKVCDVPRGSCASRQEVPTRQLGTHETWFVYSLEYTICSLMSSSDIPLVLPEDDILQLDDYLGHGLQPGETELPEDQAGMYLSLCSDIRLMAPYPATPALPEFNAEAMAQLEGMGFPTVRCQKALLATGNSDPTAAMEWLFQHMDDLGKFTNPQSDETC
jgi:ubiquitin carboxyl-terminal hydrolase 5/13